jgi:SAM-dependent methyltransferase
MAGLSIDEYPLLHERHRVFPEVFENRGHKKIIDLSAGIGIIAKRIMDNYPCQLVCNEIEATCLNNLRNLEVELTSFDLDDETAKYPFPEKSFDAVISLVTLEHLIHTEHFISEVNRILKNDGYLYLSVPNYASAIWMIPLLKGRTFHDPLDDDTRYEFYAHLRYFTYHTLLKLFASFGFKPDTVYLTLPQGSTRFQGIRDKSRMKAFLIRYILYGLYLMSARWHQEPIVCFSKTADSRKIQKVIL